MCTKAGAGTIPTNMFFNESMLAEDGLHLNEVGAKPWPHIMKALRAKSRVATITSLFSGYNLILFFPG